MRIVTRRMLGVLVGATALSVFALGIQGVLGAGAVTTRHFISGKSYQPARHVIHRASAAGLYEVIAIQSGAHTDLGPMTVNANGTWTIPGQLGGIWTSSKKTVAFSEFAFPPEHWVFLGTLTSPGISSVRKPGTALRTDGTTYTPYQWYAVRK